MGYPQKTIFVCPFLCFSNFLHRGCVSLEIEGEAFLNSKTNHFSCINLLGNLCK